MNIEVTDRIGPCVIHQLFTKTNFLTVTVPLLPYKRTSIFCGRVKVFKSLPLTFCIEESVDTWTRLYGNRTENLGLRGVYHDLIKFIFINTKLVLGPYSVYSINPSQIPVLINLSAPVSFLVPCSLTQIPTPLLIIVEIWSSSFPFLVNVFGLSRKVSPRVGNVG